jgi:DNA-directed RNA polymerase sigma subunit (sigma70/sigma32)
MDRKELINDIKIEIGNLERLNKQMKSLLSKIEKEPTFIEIRAAASILHDFYSGIEKIFERIAVSVDKNLPKGEDWHKELLLQMARPLEKIRNAVITEELLQRLKEYLRFRHLFRHIYGFELKWDRLKNLSLSLSDILNEIKNVLDKFMESTQDKK